jgi:transcriptional regulator with XRE-family HTH domain
MNQQEFLRHAMAELGLTREAFAARLGSAKRTLDKWLLPETSNDYREMDEAIWNLVREILAHEKLKTKHEKLQKKIEKSA